MFTARITIFHCSFHLIFIIIIASAYGNTNEDFGQTLTHDGFSKRARSDTPLNVKTVVAEFGKLYNHTVHKDLAYIYVYTYIERRNETTAFRVTTKSFQAKLETPIFFVVRQQRGILSWQVPLLVQSSKSAKTPSFVYGNVARTLCPLSAINRIGQQQQLYVDVSTASIENKPLPFKIITEKLTDFELKLNVERNTTVTPSMPKYYMYTFGKNDNTVIVNVQSTDNLCMRVSIQDIECPVFDLIRNVEFAGVYQSMQRRAAFTISKNIFPNGFYVVFVVSSSNIDCTRSLEMQNIGKIRKKNVTFLIRPALNKRDYLEPILFSIGWFLLFYIVALSISCIHYFTFQRHHSQPRKMDVTDRSPIIRSDALGDGSGGGEYGSIPASNSSATESASGGIPHIIKRQNSSSDSSIDEDFDKLADVEHHKEVFRTKKILHVSDLARKNHRKLSKKYRLYLWNLLTISVFYCLPVIQLVFTYQKVLNKTGNEDMCYYNFNCAIPLGQLTSFNNVFSNIGYMMLGVLFLILVFRREMLYRQVVIYSSNSDMNSNLGIPQHFGLYYAMGYALIMEGILSGCFHVCPNYSNFQFDTAFMYMIAWLIMLKIYQIRHPDINAHSHTAYFILACVIFLSVIGVVSNTVAFWVIFSIVHIFVILLLSIHVYYLGRWKINASIFKRLYILFRTDILKCAKPAYKDRLILLTIVNAINIGLAFFAMFKQPGAFALWLLAIFILNLLMYFAFYIIMKLRSKEKLLPLPLIFTLIAAILWACSFKFFFSNLTDWHTTASLSRNSNRDCILFKFYDDHDIWHFFSAMSLFFSFMVVLTLDDDLSETPRDTIVVF